MSPTPDDYGGGSTAWTSYTVPQLMSFLQWEDDDLSWSQASTWQKTSELISYYQSELQQRRNELAAKWPPERSPAAQVFVQYVDDLLTSMQQTSLQAYTNSGAVAGITAALAEAKRKITTLNTTWQENENKEKHPRIIAAGKGGAISSPQVAPNWRDQMKQEAAKVMEAADTAVFDHTTKLQVPESYQPSPPISDGGTPRSPGGGFNAGGGTSSGGIGSSRAPVIPPPPPTPTPPGPVLTGGPGPGPTTTLPPPLLPSPGDPPVGRVITPGGGPPVLPVFPGMPGPGLPGRVIKPTMPVGLGPVEPPPPKPNVPGKTFLGRGGEPLPGRSGLPGMAEPLPPEGSLRPGMPMAPMGGPAGRPTSTAAGQGATAPRRANPVGGVVGGRGGETFTTPSGHTVSIGPRRTRQDSRERQVGDTHFDPDNPWAVAVGVPPVIEPSPEPQRHDPGPGVIGIDR